MQFTYTYQKATTVKLFESKLLIHGLPFFCKKAFLIERQVCENRGFYFFIYDFHFKENTK